MGKKHKPHHNFHSTLDTIGRCQVHDKIIYRSKSAAKRSTRNLTHKHMSVYPCDHTGMYHTGHLAEVVINGEVTRDRIYNKEVIVDQEQDRSFGVRVTDEEPTAQSSLDFVRAHNICRNCGELGHFTQDCKGFGPLYPEEGKTSQDYGEQNQQILDKIAQQIVEEHDEPVADPPSLG